MTLAALILVGIIARGLVVSLFPFPYKGLIERFADRERLDPYLLAAVVKVESSYDPSALSSKGARGLMQVMPETAAWCASQMELGTVDLERLFEPELNLMIGAWYLAHLHDEFGGNEVVALAAYNSGRGRVRAWLEDTWDGTLEGLDSVPYPETRGFVRRVLMSRVVYQLLYGGRIEVSLNELGHYLRE